ncbi:MAG TPA: chemotaxis protein CheW [Methylophaga aminisulfidivorans]|uniref:Chemotaxis protein CheW n=2 Tax=root TaxID=1 RepID=A0A7C2AQA4_9GAMM|nr:chemotaxis protein CheW [Methylophaga aminisulfidivorans]HEC74554.1 chemotaxis protein CheW [Methylophaga aminisulfidivorans]
MSDTQNTPYIHCMLIPLQQHYLLLPNSTITEVIPRASIAHTTNSSKTWLEHIDWQQITVPVVDLEKLLTESVDQIYRASKLCIIAGINNEANIEFYAFPCTGSPQLITLNATAFKLTHDTNDSAYLHCQIKIGNQIAFVPNLDELELLIQQNKLSENKLAEID